MRKAQYSVLSWTAHAVHIRVGIRNEGMSGQVTVADCILKLMLYSEYDCTDSEAKLLEASRGAGGYEI